MYYINFIFSSFILFTSCGENINKGFDIVYEFIFSMDQFKNE